MTTEIEIGTRVGAGPGEGEAVWMDLARGDVLLSPSEPGAPSPPMRWLRERAVREGMNTVELGRGETFKSMEHRLLRLEEQSREDDAPHGVAFIDSIDGDWSLSKLRAALLPRKDDRHFTLVVSAGQDSLDPALFTSWVTWKKPPLAQLTTGATTVDFKVEVGRDRASRFPVISAQQAAEYLDLTPGRIRQLVAQGELRRAPIPVRDLVVRRDDVERYAKSKRSALTLRLYDVPTPPQARSLTYESLVVVDDQQLHVRLFVGDDDLQVLLVGYPEGHPRPLRENAQDIAAALFDLVPGLSPSRTAFVELSVDEGVSGNAYVLREVIFQVPDLSAPEIVKYESTHPVDWEGLLRALGVRPELYHFTTYTPEVIEEHLRTRRPVSVEHDKLGIRTKDRWVRALDRQGDSLVSRELVRLLVDEIWLQMRTTGVPWQVGESMVKFADPVVSYAAEPGSTEVELAQMTEALHAAVARMTRESTRRDLYPSDGYPWAPTATRLIPVVLPPRLSALVVRHPDDSFSYTREEGAALRTELLELERSNEPHRPGANADLLEAARFGVAAMYPRQRLSADERDRQQLELPRPAYADRGWVLRDGDDVTSRYLEGIKWQSDRASDFTSAEKADLAHAAGLVEVEKWGRAPDGDLVGTGQDALGQTRVVVVQSIAAPRPLEKDDLLVSATIGSGDIPLFVQRRGRIVSLVPPRNVFMGMNYGYGGGGPGAAAAAVVDLLQRSGHEVDRVHARKIEVCLEDPVWAEGTNVELSIGDLLMLGDNPA